ncbi:MAG TPA: bifunctional 3-phosphoshikimate 1-carboxyvinyltransferase/cytidylate kinase [Caldimonas sp.]|jgi:3-phosphoshikimate 1-carboxyvinyltransferase|nr:bifunctional 3-phosphoshikimate 1-carboxyvinyltransferase/cytidylate kinase [Caldimonas sp.]HEX2543214.1 bifunctional 3-phosphoshikimate 1-carboxyvinyltransferase/cytidylate kinase [Caldimonas sp.]
MYTTRFLDLPALSGIGGVVRVPGSKSISNRALLLAGFAAGTTTIEGLLHSDDTRVMLQALAQLGCAIASEGERVAVTGLGGRPAVGQARLQLGNAGTAMRPLVAALAITAPEGAAYELSGTARMHERPIGDLVDALRALGCRIDYRGREGYPPLAIGSGVAAGVSAGVAEGSAGRPVRVRGDVSSQFLTSLLLALPLRAAATAAVIEVDGELISRPYVDITLRLLERFGITVAREGWQRFTLPGGQPLRSPGDFMVEGDASSASYFVAAGAIAAADDGLRIEGVGSDSIQGDIAFVDAVRAMGARIEASPGRLDVHAARLPLSPIVLDCNHIPDAAMTLAALALFANGRSRLENIASWRVKETDRLSAMATELRKVGAVVTEGSDFLEIDPPRRWRPATIATYDDHRMAMAMSLAAFNAAAGASPAVPVRILDPRCVGKTWPEYFETLLGVAGAQRSSIPVLTIDGPTASGKGTLASAVAAALGYHLLDSGALYRATAIAAIDADIAADNEDGLATVAAGMDLRFDGGRAFLGPREVTVALRREDVGALASRISAWPRVRRALLDLQLAFRRLPGLVADGRDMGTVVFPDAELKVFLTASAAERAIRRARQLEKMGFSANIDGLRADLEGRDARDMNRSASPLKPAEDALLLDNSALSIEASTEAVLEAWEQRRPFDRSPV